MKNTLLPFVLCALAVGAAAQNGSYTPPASPRARMNFDLNWKFIREDVAGAEAPAFDDSKWATVTTPHSFNDVDSFRQIISHGGGDRGTECQQQRRRDEAAERHRPEQCDGAGRGES